MFEPNGALQPFLEPPANQSRVKEPDAASTILQAGPALRDDPYHPNAVAARIRPDYRPNPAHDPTSSLYDPRKTPEPPDARAVYQNAIRTDFGTWFGLGAEGWYRFSGDNAGGAHFSGIIDDNRVPVEVRRGQQ